MSPGVARTRSACGERTVHDLTKTKTTVVFLNANQEVPVSTTEVHDRMGGTSVGNVDLKLEVQIIPVSDVDRAKAFYERLGFRLDGDVAPLDGLRIVQFTPPGSATSVTFGLGIITAEPGSAENGLIVSDIEAARDVLVGRGIEVSEIWHGPPFPVEARRLGVDPDRTSYGSFFSFDDPDGNTWLVQEVTTRAPGRMNAAETGYVSASDLEAALRRAEAAHSEHEKHNARSHLFHHSSQNGDRPAWYAAYMVAEQAGTDLPS
jgi:catechol 2,3-dioxygenase-like lactoylglutathione lyase family enzyme